MNTPLSDEEFDVVRSASAEIRYDYAVRRIARDGKLWSLSTDDGWVLYGDDEGREILPIWPHPRFAALCALNEFSHAQPREIQLETWVEQWTAALNQHERSVAVFPDAEGHSIVLSPDDIEDDLLFDHELLEAELEDEDDTEEIDDE